MAQLLKDRARNPLVDEIGGTVGSQSVIQGKLGYRIDIYQRHPGHSYSVLLSRTEMLKVVQSWMAGEARLAEEQDRAAVSSSAEKP